MRHKGSTYAVLPRSAMCSCSLLSGSYFIAQTLCPTALSNLKLQYPINAAVAIVFESELDKKLQYANLSALHDQPYPINAPTPDLNLDLENDVLLSHNIEQVADLEKLANIMRHEKKVYFDKHHKFSETDGFRNWFTTTENIVYGIGFILSILGGIACAIACHNCVKQYKTSALMGSFLAQVRDAKALEGGEENIPECKGVALSGFILKIGVVLGIIITYRLLKYMYQRWSVIKILLPNEIPQDASDACHIHLEIGNGRKMERFYLCTIPCNPLGISFQGVIPYVQLKLTRNVCFATLTIPWANGTFQIRCHNHRVELPQVTHVNVFRVRSV